jgi:hypothetical protein
LDETEQRHQQRTLATASSTNNANLRSVWQLEGDTIKGRRERGRVLETDVSELLRRE